MWTVDENNGRFYLTCRINWIRSNWCFITSTRHKQVAQEICNILNNAEELKKIVDKNRTKQVKTNHSWKPDGLDTHNSCQTWQNDPSV